MELSAIKAFSVGGMPMKAEAARRLWSVLEPYHAAVYFAPEVASAMKDVGLKGYWMGYFAGRAAPMGPVTPGVVTATFYNFAPRMVHRAIPDAWGFASPDDIIGARNAALHQTLRRLLDDMLDGDEVKVAAALARQAAEQAKPEGRPIFAALATLPWPEEPHMALWHAATLLREHRGDGHVVALTAAGLDGCQAHVSTGSPREVVQPNRGWTDEEWAAAEAGLHARGWSAADRQAVEEHTDRLAMGPVEALGPEKLNDLLTAMAPVAARVVVNGGVPFPNPMGLPPDK